MRVKIWMMTGVLLFGGTMMRAQGTSSGVKDDLFAGTEKFAANASSVTEVDMDPDSLGMVNGSNSGRAKRTVLSVVHTYTYDKPGMYNMADVEAFRNKLNTGDWHCSVHVRELKTGESTDVCRKHRNDDLEETAIVTVEPKELTFIHTIRRPMPQGGKPGGGESLMVAPFEDFPGVGGMPPAAWAAEMRAQSAEMRAMAMVNRAEMQAMMPGLRVSLGEGMMPVYRMPAIDAERLQDLTRQLHNMPELQRLAPPAVPEVPAVPGGVTAPKAPAVPQSSERPVPPQPALSAV